MNTTQFRRGPVVRSIPGQSACLGQVSQHRTIEEITSYFGAHPDDEYISEETLPMCSPPEYRR